ncbi:L-seryl-tRNA(Sec) kinase isoform 2-T2 [Thomomys bottae]
MGSKHPLRTPRLAVSSATPLGGAAVPQGPRMRTRAAQFRRLPRRPRYDGHGGRGGGRPGAVHAGALRPLRLAGGRKVDLRAGPRPPAAAGARLGGGRPLLRRRPARGSPGPGDWRAAADSLGFCQLYLDCPLETCLQRNGQRPRAVPNETIHLMGKKIEKPNPGKNAWEHNSLAVQSPVCSTEASLEVTEILLTALENPVKHAENNVEQKETDRIICSANILHKADQALRRTVSQTMKEAKDEQILPNNLKLLAEELNKLKAGFLEDLRQGNKYPCFPQTTDISDVISSFCNEKDNIMQKYFSKHH